MENALAIKLGNLCTFLIPKESKPAIDTLLKIIKNALDNPKNEKYRQLKLSNQKFYQQVWRHSAAQEFLALVGWTVKEEKLVLQSDNFLREAYAELTKAKDFIETKQSKTLAMHYGISPEVEKTVLEQLQLPEDERDAFLKKFRKYCSLLPESLADYHDKFVRMSRMATEAGPYHEIRMYFPVVRQEHVTEFQKELQLLEEQDNLRQRRSKPEITGSELQSIENQLGQLAKEEQALERRYEARNIAYLQQAIKSFPNYDTSTLQEELREREEQYAKAVPDSEPFKFSHYVSSLPDSVHEFLDKQLDWDHGGVDEHLNKIADHMMDWETKLSSLLRLSDIDIYNLKEKYSDPILLRRAVVRKWKEKKGLDATYRSLLKLCCEGGDARTASTICSVLKEKVQKMKEDTVPSSYRVSNDKENTGSSPPDPGYTIICPNCKFLIKASDMSQANN